MSVNTINNYGMVSGASDMTESRTGKTTGSNSLTMDDFFKLLVAQLANQDMYNTVDDNEFIAQMAQFSMVQALSDLSQASATSYAVNLIGKEVTLTKNNADGSTGTLTGIVEGVNLRKGSAQIIVEGREYPLSSALLVREPKIIVPDANSLNQANLLKEISELVDEVSDLNSSIRAGSAAGAEDPDDSGEAEGEGDV